MSIDGARKKKDILVVSHIWCKKKIEDTALLISKARELAACYGARYFACIYMQEEFETERLQFCGAEKIYLVKISEIEMIHTAGIISITKKIIDEIQPNVVIFDASKLINDIAPRLAVEYDTGLTADCIDFRICERTQKLLQIRSAFEGDMIATIVCPEKMPQMATARLLPENVCPYKDGHCSDILRIDCSDADLKERAQIQLVSSVMKHVEESGNDVYIGVGRGAAFSDEAMRLIAELAELLGAKLVATRTVVEAGKLDYSRQVGITGKTISPKVFIACGISGAVQHMMGILHTDFLFAINQDAEAEIFKICDYGIVGKVETVVKMLNDGLMNS